MALICLQAKLVSRRNTSLTTRVGAWSRRGRECELVKVEVARPRLLVQAFLLICVAFAVAHAQSATYHLHREASTTTNLFQLKTANPDAASLAVQSTNLKNKAAGEYPIKAFDTQSGVPNASGTIAAGSDADIVIWDPDAGYVTGNGAIAVILFRQDGNGCHSG